MKYNKLVRDNIPERIQQKGEKVVTHVASDEEYWNKLIEKLGEEIKEFKKSENIEELADILEVLQAIANYKGFDKKEVRRVMQKKSKEKGKFDRRIILDES